MNLKTGRPIEDEAWLRKYTFSEEERLSLTSAEWAGGFRWFASPNIIPLEHYRDREQTTRTLDALRRYKQEREARAIGDLIRRGRG
jgi:hypothetical protein